MGKFNKVSEGYKNVRANTVNAAGGEAFAIEDPKKELASVILASMLNGDSYYTTEAQRLAQVENLAKNIEDKSFLAKSMIYARNVGNLRSISHVLANFLVENASGASYLRTAIKKAINRPDDMTEMAAFWFSRHNTMLPNSMRRAFKDLLESNKWDAYQLKKYLKENGEVKLRDIVLISHPRDKRGLLKKVIEGSIEAPKTLESKLASGEKASEAVTEMLSEKRLGYMAAVKNIRNALMSGISEDALNAWYQLITDPKAIKKSRMLPFRFYDAWMAVKDVPCNPFHKKLVREAFDIALVHSAYNLDMVNDGERIALILDESGSMHGEPWKNAIILAAVLYHAFGSRNVVTYFFANDCREVNFGNMSPIDIIEKYDMASGSATFFHAPMAKLISDKVNVHKLIVLTDMQLYAANAYTPTYRDTYGRVRSRSNFSDYVAEYRTKVNRNVKVLFWDLKGYGRGTPAELKENILLLSGFSDKLLSVIPKMWRDENALVKEIEAISLT